MRKLFKGSLFAVAMVVLLIGVYFAGYHACYQRYANYHFDISSTSLHIQWKIERLDGSIEYQYHAGVITTIGKNWIEDQLGDSPGTDPAKWISLSSDTGSPAVGWTQIPSEIASGGLERASGTYASTGDGQWTIEHQFTASATHTDVQLTGLQWASSGDGNLFGADTFTPVTLNSGEKLTVTATVTVT